MLAEIERKIFTTDEYHHMTEAGILGEDDRLELVEGEIVNMAAIGSNHAACVKRLNRLFTENLSDRVITGVQDPVRIGEYSEPEPDIALLNPRADFYAAGHPGPEDVLLIIEVSDTSLEYDRKVKLPLYAEAGIEEVWIVNLNDFCIEVYKNPAESGYRLIRRCRKGDFLRPGAFPDMEIAAGDVLINVFDKESDGII